MSYDDLITNFTSDLFLFNNCPCFKQLVCFLNMILNITATVADILHFHQRSLLRNFSFNTNCLKYHVLIGGAFLHNSKTFFIVLNPTLCKTLPPLCPVSPNYKHVLQWELFPCTDWSCVIITEVPSSGIDQHTIELSGYKPKREDCRYPKSKWEANK